MKSYKFFLNKKTKLPDVVIIPIVYNKPRKGANFIEKLLFYFESASGKSKLIVLSKRIIQMVGGLDSSLGFGEDRNLERKIFKTINVNRKIAKLFGI